MKRRDFLALGTLGTCAYLGSRRSALGLDDDPRLKTRPTPATAALDPGPHSLVSRDGRGGILYIPKGHDPRIAAPLAVMLHGAGNSSQGMDWTFRLGDEQGVMVLAPDSRDLTWDAVIGEFGPDVRYIDSALAYTFRRALVDPKRIAIGGFSDGASYALSLGLANGDLFNYIIAFSPGFVASINGVGRPRIFISHGKQDQVLSIETTSRDMVPKLRAAGYDVTYQEFDGPHVVPPEIARQAFGWLTG
jgi:phospholipase/carboxylesterase